MLSLNVHFADEPRPHTVTLPDEFSFDVEWGAHDQGVLIIYEGVDKHLKAAIPLPGPRLIEVVGERDS